MSRCDQELCPYWTGDGCACAVMGLDPSAAREALIRDGFMEREATDG